jgi:ABC-type antimicrobial peptide transport system permease subunit
MLENYIKVAYRYLVRNKVFTILNVFGLVVSMTGAMLIFLWIGREISVDRFHENGDQIYEVWNNNLVDGEIWSWNSTPCILGPVVSQRFPEIVAFSRHKYVGDRLFTFEDKQLNRETVFVDSTFLEMFSFKLIEGNPSEVLSGKFSVVISESLASALFGNENPVSRMIRFENRLDLEITGVFEDLMNNTDFEFEALVSWGVFEKLGFTDENWKNNFLETFVQLDEQADLAMVNDKIRDIKKEHIEGETTDVFLYPLEERYLYSNFENGLPVGGNIDRVGMFLLIAVFILIIACINFMNLSTAQSERRSKEVGMRKVSGARKGSLIGQFMVESILLSLFSGLMALSLLQLILPYFNTLINLNLTIPISSLLFWVLSLSFILLTGLLAGSYPAFLLSSFQPIKVLKGSFKRSGSNYSPRKVLVVVQFTFAIILIASTMIVKNQIEHAQKRDLGYEKSQLIYHTLTDEIGEGFEAFRRDLLEKKLARAVTKSFSPITQNWSNSWEIKWDGKNEDQKKLVYRFSADRKPVETFGLTLLEGRDLDIDRYATDSLAVLLNREAVRTMGFKDPIGQVIGDNFKKWHVIGVVENFVNGSAFGKDKPVVIFGPKSWFGVFHIRLNDQLHTSDNIAAIDQVFTTHFPDVPFEYQFIDNDFARSFESQERTAMLTLIFSGLAIMISCLGLFGLSAFAGEQRSKEIGVRKVLGASVARIVWLLSTDFVKLVVIAFLLATPLAWFAMDQWLAGFDYRVSITPSVFLITGFIAVVIAFATISYQAIKAASLNPVKTLKDE